MSNNPTSRKALISIVAAISYFAMHRAVATQMLFDIDQTTVPAALQMWSAQANIEILFVSDYWFKYGGRPRAIKLITDPINALELIVRDIDARVEWINSTTVVLVPGRSKCNPSLGAKAPLPPCVPPPHVGNSS